MAKGLCGQPRELFRQRESIMRYAILIAIAVVATMPELCADEFTVDFDAAPSTHYLDRWGYPFNVTPGTRIQAPTFGAVGSVGFDDRDGQFILAIDTAAAGIESGKSPSQYSIESVRLTLTESVGGYRFDGTYDEFVTYLASDNALYQPDSDVGRPVELYGAGFRNEFETFGFPDGGVATDAPVYSAGSPYGPSDRGTRSVFAVDAHGGDVSNNIDSLNQGIDGFDPTPFAVGQAFSGDDPIPAGREVDAGTQFVFEVDVKDSAILSYVQQGLSSGQLGFILTSLHGTGVMGAGDPFVNLATSNHFAIAAPVFEISVSINDGLPGDFDGDGVLTSHDINDLANEVNNGTGNTAYDLNADSLVDSEDLAYWIEEVFGSYFGDSNLDGEFNSSDFVAVFTTGEYEDDVPMNSSWATGDWNGDNEFDTKDFVLAFQSRGYEQGPRLAAAVPEPTPMLACVLWVFAIVSARRSVI